MPLDEAIIHSLDAPDAGGTCGVPERELRRLLS
jgi:hypothetical protein